LKDHRAGLFLHLAHHQKDKEQAGRDKPYFTDVLSSALPSRELQAIFWSASTSAIIA